MRRGARADEERRRGDGELRLQILAYPLDNKFHSLNVLR